MRLAVPVCSALTEDESEITEDNHKAHPRTRKISTPRDVIDTDDLYARLHCLIPVYIILRISLVILHPNPETSERSVVETKRTTEGKPRFHRSLHLVAKSPPLRCSPPAFQQLPLSMSSRKLS
jgi:hypothetical protein